MLRAFIAIEIPEPIKQEIADQTAGLRRELGHNVRWVAAGNLHLTLKFLGDIAGSQIDALARAIGAETKSHHKFDITLENFGSFPNSQRPRILWAGVTAPAALNELQQGIEAVVGRADHPAEDRAYSPHLTIGRVRDGLPAPQLQAVSHALQKSRRAQLGSFTAQSVALFRSELKPGGPTYTCLFTSALGGRLIDEVKPESA